MYFNWKREKSRKKKEETTTGPPLARSTPGRRARDSVYSDTMKRPFSNKWWCRTRHRKSMDATNALVHEKHVPVAFQNLILKINVILLKSPS